MTVPVRIVELLVHVEALFGSAQGERSPYCRFWGMEDRMVGLGAFPVFLGVDERLVEMGVSDEARYHRLNPIRLYDGRGRGIGVDGWNGRSGDIRTFGGETSRGSFLALLPAATARSVETLG